jgi:hypothetical protein
LATENGGLQLRVDNAFAQVIGSQDRDRSRDTVLGTNIEGLEADDMSHV